MLCPSCKKAEMIPLKTLHQRFVDLRGRSVMVSIQRCPCCLLDQEYKELKQAPQVELPSVSVVKDHQLVSQLTLF